MHHRRTAGALLLATATLLAQAAGAAPAPGFGVAAAVRGEVTVTPAGGGAPQPLKGGDVVAPGDRIDTGPGGGLQVLLTDETVFSLGEDTRFRLERYRYDAGDASGEIHASVPRGAFKVTSGRIGEAHPERITLELPTGTLALRGTVVAGRSAPEGDTVGLLGPGARRESLEKKGAFVFIPRKGAAVRTAEDEIVVYRAGYAVTVGTDGEVSEPFAMSGRELGQLVAGLAGYRRGGGPVATAPAAATASTATPRTPPSRTTGTSTASGADIPTTTAASRASTTPTRTASVATSRTVTRTIASRSRRWSAASSRTTTSSRACRSRGWRT